ncbi:MAG: energy transducer TonB [Nitrospirota bacterium]
MTAVEISPLAQSHESHHAQGWIVSMFCHAFGIGGVLLLLADFETPVRPNTFQWEVAMVEAPPTVEPPPAPSTPTPVPQRQVERSIDPLPPVKTIEAVPQTVHDVVTPNEAILERSIAQTTESSTVVTQAVTTNHESVAEQATVEYAPIVRQKELVAQESPRSDSQSFEVEHRVVQHRLVTVRETQTDYGWLRDALWGRIHELKRYPSQAKEHHWEGKVVVQAVIRADGTIVECEVAESSGRAILDQEALAVMKKASPLTLKHPLGKANITLLIPINYKLEG